MSISNSEGQIKLTSKAWRQFLDLIQNCPALQLYCVEADHNSTIKVLLTNNAGRSQMKMLSTWMWSQLQTTSENPPPLSSSIRWLIHVFLCLLYYTVLYHFGMQGHWIVSSLSKFLSCTLGRKQTGLFNNKTKCSESGYFQNKNSFKERFVYFSWKALSTFVLTVERQINTIVHRIEYTPSLTWNNKIEYKILK